MWFTPISYHICSIFNEINKTSLKKKYRQKWYFKIFPLPPSHGFDKLAHVRKEGLRIFAYRRELHDMKRMRRKAGREDKSDVFLKDLVADWKLGCGEVKSGGYKDEEMYGSNAVCFQAVTGAEEERICWFAKRKISLRRESVCFFFWAAWASELCSAAVLLEVLHAVHDPKLC